MNFVGHEQFGVARGYDYSKYSGPSLIRTPWDRDWSVCVKCLHN